MNKARIKKGNKVDDLSINATGYSLEQLRNLFPITRESIYLFNGNIIPCATPVREAMQAFLEDWTRHGDGCWTTGAQAFAEGKLLFAELIHASPETIVGIPNTTTGINLAALMIRPQAGQNVVVTELEHMSDVYPWLAFKKQGVEIRYVPAREGRIELDEFSNYVDDQTAAVSICHVTMGTGFRWDLAQACKIAKGHGAKVVVDAAQSVGAVPTDVSAWGVDILAAPSFKWMLGPLGAGFMYVCPELIAACDPPLPGWFGVTNPGENDLHHPRWHQTAHKFERGVPSMIGFVGAAAGLKLLREVGHEAVFDRIAELASYLYEGLSELGVTLCTPRQPARRAGIVAIQLPGQDRLWKQLEESRIHIGNWLGCLRIDPGCYNTETELDVLLQRVRKFMAA